MSKLEHLLSRLRQVKGRNGSFTACCPAHEDSSPSLAVRETPDGRILVHCFGGCSVEEVLGAAGMEIGDLFPETRENRGRVKPRFFATDLLRIIHREALIVALVASDIHQGRLVSPEDQERLLVARNRILEALDHAG